MGEFNAQAMREITSRQKHPINLIIEEFIENTIKSKANAGYSEAVFYDLETGLYLDKHKEYYEALGFEVNIEEGFWGSITATVSWSKEK